MSKIKIAVSSAKILSLDSLLPALAFSIPLFISGPQLLTGTIVNSLLFLTAEKNFNQRTVLAVSIFPSLGALSNGILFGKFTFFLAFFLPFIAFSNLLLIHSFSFFKKKSHSIWAIIFSALLKTVFLYFFALVYFKLNIIPSLFLSSMGINQLLTGISGGIIASIIIAFNKRYE